ncbi:sigma-70 family RNA polymerase sigma factor [Streptomyces sp. NPDC048643]|uniref:sigma-70 family RNA polymerase sigma factor n=1 Tax=Streptomyces sp. NPDC048643 TaxID=3155637 RepID=UPI00341EC87A
MLSFDTIKAAQSEDKLAAVTAAATIVEAMAGRIKTHADRAARRMAPHGGARLADYQDEFAQVGRVAVFDALSRFTDTTVDAFERYVYTTVENAMKDAVRSERNGGAGADENAVKTFAAMIEAAEGNLHKAEKMCQTEPPAGRRMSPERAHAARLAWQGALSLDKVTGAREHTEASGTIADTLAYHDEEPDGEIRPKVGRGAVIEAAMVLERYVPVPTDHKARKFLAHALTVGLAGYATPDTVDALEDVITLPRDPETRRYVLDAMAVFSAAASTATDGELAADLRDVRDDRMADSREKHDRVNGVLDSMGAAQRDVLRHSFGIGDVMEFGWGDGCDMEGLCEALGMTYVNAKAHRAKGRKAFAKRYVAAVAVSKPALAAVLEAAAAAQLTNKGRK